MSGTPGRVVATGALFAAIATAVAATWPVAIHLQDHLVDVVDGKSPWWNAGLAADAEQTVWIVNWNLHALVTQPLHLFDANILYPSPKPLARAEHMFGVSLLGIPAALVGGPVFVHQSILLLCGVLNFLAAAWVVWVWTNSQAGALVAGFTYTFAAYQVDGIHHLQSLSVGFLPLLLLGIERTCATGDRRWAAMGAGALAFQILSGQYLGFWALLSWCVACGVAVAAGRPGIPRARQVLRDFGWLLVLALAAGLVVLPFLTPYLELRSAGELSHEVAYLPYALYSLGAYVWSWEPNPGVQVAPWLWPFVIAGAVECSTRGRRGWTQLAILAAVGFVLALVSLGPRPDGRSVFDFAALLLPGFESARAPARAAIVPLLVAALLSGCGVSLLARYWPRVAAAAVPLVALIAALQWGLAPVPLRKIPTLPDLPPGYEFLMRCGSGDPLLELPVPRLSKNYRETTRMIMATHHWLPLLNGRVTYRPPEYERFTDLAGSLPGPRALSELRDWSGVRWVRLDCTSRNQLKPGLRHLCNKGATLRGAQRHEFGDVRIFDLGPVDRLPREYPRRWAPDPTCRP